MNAAERALRAAIAKGDLPATASLAPQEGRPWPVVLLTALGAWLAALPLLGVVGMLLGDIVIRGVGPYFTGALMLVGAAVVLRSATVPVFVEQLAIPGLLVGAGTLGFGLFRDLPVQAAALVLLLVTVGLALAVPRAWLRALLGVAAAALLMVMLVPEKVFVGQRNPVNVFWLALHGVLAVWLVALALQRRVLLGGMRAQAAAAVESLAAGWVLALLVGLGWLAGMSFLVGGTLGSGFAAEVARDLGPRMRLGWESYAVQAASVVLAVAAAYWPARCWPALRQPLLAAAAAVVVVLAWFLPSLGAVLLILAVTGTTRRWALASAAGAATAWIIGGFYYQLHWPLAHKAVVLAVAGAALGGLARLAYRHQRRNEIFATSSLAEASAAARAPAQHHAAWLALAAVATLAVANFAIWQKENIIAKGQPVFVALAPVDPRSLMQGDYMRLNFLLPPDLEKDIDNLVTRTRPQVVATRDARGVATLLRLDRANAPLASGEFRIELTPKDGGWILVSDAWFFSEGDAARWEKAKFGEFRILPGGAALLVGMADGELRPIGR